MDNLNPCPFCGGPASLREELLKIYVQCDWCLSSSDESHSIAAVREAWNTRRTFDWFATLAACQMWKNEHERAAILATKLDFYRIERDKAERLLLKATQCLSALCDGNMIDDNTRMLRRELEQWVSEAMPF